MAKRIRKILVRSLVVVIALPVVLAGASISMARLEVSDKGIHTRLLLPVTPQSSIAVHNYGASGDAARIPGFLDGPVVRRGAGATWSATWFCEDRAVQSKGSGDSLSIDCAGKSHTFALARAAAPAAEVAQMPARLVALSDIEGNLAFLDGALRKLALVDSDGNWAFGANRLVLVGDSVDRGRDVFGVLWRLHGLALQAEAAGGALHVVIGNHEQYMLAGKMKSVHPEHAYGAEQMGGFRQAFGADTVLGDWLRRQPVVLRIGDVLFTHGGVSPAVAAGQRSPAQLNDSMVRYWRGEAAAKEDMEAVMGMDGLTQYRAMVGDEVSGRKASVDEVDQALKAFGVRRVVLGHTQVPRVSALYGGKVYAINVNDNDAAPEVLVFEQGVPAIVDIGVSRNLPDEKKAPMKERPLRLTDAADRQVVWRLIARNYELSQLPRYY